MVYKRLINVFIRFTKSEEYLNLTFILDDDVRTAILRETGEIFLLVYLAVSLLFEAIIKLDQGRICGQMQDVSTGKGKSSCYSAMPQARGLKFYYVIADPKVGE